MSVKSRTHYNLYVSKVKNTLELMSDCFTDRIVQTVDKTISLSFRQLLLDCGIGVTDNTTSDDALNAVVSQHRALIFCQLKSMLNIVENDLLK